jgi:mono/diheme cytochrome c family protein
MSAWKECAYAGFVCSPALLILFGLAPATGTNSIGPEPVVTESASMRLAQNTTTAAGASEEPAEEEVPTFTEDFLDDPAHITAGKEVWDGTCRGCHGAQAYPGKAPKLRPKKYTPDFVFDRVTNGYKKMPPWKEVFSKEERMNVVAWVLSDRFAP